MADYYPLLAKAVSGLPSSNREQRAAIYERARKALLGQLRNITPAVDEADIERESQALDAAIARLEDELSQNLTSSSGPATPALRKSLPPLPPLPPKLDLAELSKSHRAKTSSRPEDNRVVAPKEPVPASAQEPVRKTIEKPDIKPISAPAPEFVASNQKVQERPVLAPNSSGPILKPSAPSETKAQPDAPVLVADKEPVFAPITTRDLSQAQPKTQSKLTPLRFLFGLAVLSCVIITAILAFYWRDIPQGTIRPTSAEAQQTQEPVETPSKIVDRIGGPQIQASPQTEASLSQSQRAALLIEAPEEQQKFKTYLGNVSWRMENVGRGQGQPLAQALRIDVDITEANLKLMVLIQKNADKALPASHMISMRFLPQQKSVISEVSEIELPLIRNEASTELDPLVGVIAKITQNMFLIGLNNDAVISARNMEFLKARNWLDIPMRLSDGRLAKITFEKGSAGERVMNDALASWR
jgi:hypothetical protein